jgi:hypothetical protein
MAITETSRKHNNNNNNNNISKAIKKIQIYERCIVVEHIKEQIDIE